MSKQIADREISVIQIHSDDGRLIARWDGESPFAKVTFNDEFSLNTAYLSPHKKWEVGNVVNVFQWRLRIIGYEGRDVWLLKREDYEG